MAKPMFDPEGLPEPPRGIFARARDVASSALARARRAPAAYWVLGLGAGALAVDYLVEGKDSVMASAYRGLFGHKRQGAPPALPAAHVPAPGGASPSSPPGYYVAPGAAPGIAPGAAWSYPLQVDSYYAPPYLPEVEAPGYYGPPAWPSSPAPSYYQSAPAFYPAPRPEGYWGGPHGAWGGWGGRGGWPAGARVFRERPDERAFRERRERLEHRGRRRMWER